MWQECGKSVASVASVASGKARVWHTSGGREGISVGLAPDLLEDQNQMNRNRAVALNNALLLLSLHSKLILKAKTIAKIQFKYQSHI